MKSYAIKRDDEKYYQDDIGGFLNFTDSLNSACIWGKEVGADETKDYIIRKEWLFGKQNLQIVPVTIIEDDLEEHDKQVRNELIDKLKNSFTFKLATELDFKLNHSQTTNKECYDRIMRTKENLDKILDQLKGENNGKD